MEKRALQKYRTNLIRFAHVFKDAVEGRTVEESLLD